MEISSGNGTKRHIVSPMDYKLSLFLSKFSNDGYNDIVISNNLVNKEIYQSSGSGPIRGGGGSAAVRQGEPEPATNLKKNNLEINELDNDTTLLSELDLKEEVLSIRKNLIKKTLFFTFKVTDDTVIIKNEVEDVIDLDLKSDSTGEFKE